MREIHIFATSDGPYGWYAESPQLPGLIIARDTQEELAVDLRTVLRETVGTDEPYKVIGHLQGRVRVEGHPDVLISAQEGIGMLERMASFSRIEVILRSQPDFWAFLPAADPVLGEIRVVAVAPSDILQGILDQLDGSTSAPVAIAMAIDDTGLWTVHLAAGTPLDHPDWTTFQAAGISPTMTIAELRDRLPENMTGPGHLLALAGA
jgi:hypothetical protein